MSRKNPMVIIGVIYNSYSEVTRFIESIGRCFDHDMKLILVDNSENPPDSFFIEKINHYDFITYIKSKKNLGYFHGAELGLNHFLQNNHNYPQWIIVCNVDIIFESPQLLEKLGSYETVPDLGAIAPAIISNRWKTDLNPFRMSRISLNRLYFYRIIYSNIMFHNGYIVLHYLKRIIKIISRMVSPPGKGEIKERRKIYAPHGSCIIFNKNYFESGGTLNHISFLFGEEIFVGETIIKSGLNVLYGPELKFRHYEHSSIGSFISPKINRYYKQSIEDIINNYYQ